MSDLEKYIQKREKRNPNFRRELDEERRNLRIGLLIKELRLEKGMRNLGMIFPGSTDHKFQLLRHFVVDMGFSALCGKAVTRSHRFQASHRRKKSSSHHIVLEVA